jgi:hypothetical protein
MDPLVLGGFRIDVRGQGEGDPLILDWHGVCNERDPRAWLDPFLTTAIAEAGRAGRIELHFEELEYGNSSMLASIIDFTQNALARGLQLIFVFTPTRRWQKLSFEALRVFDDGGGRLILRSA